MDLILSVSFLVLALLGLILAARDWRNSRVRSLFLVSFAFLLLVPIGFWDVMLSWINVSLGYRLIYKSAALVLCFFVYLLHYLGTRSKDADESDEV